MAPQPCGTTERDQTATLLRRISRALREPNDEAWLNLDLSMAQLKLLFVLAARGPAAVGTLAQAARVTLPTVSVTLDRLVRAGYVERQDDPDDRRLVINHLTADGAALVERLREARRQRVEQALDALDPAQLDLLRRGLLALAGAMQLPPPTSPPAEPVADPGAVVAV